MSGALKRTNMKNAYEFHAMVKHSGDIHVYRSEAARWQQVAGEVKGPKTNNFKIKTQADE